MTPADLLVGQIDAELLGLSSAKLMRYSQWSGDDALVRLFVGPLHLHRTLPDPAVRKSAALPRRNARETMSA